MMKSSQIGTNSSTSMVDVDQQYKKNGPNIGAKHTTKSTSPTMNILQANGIKNKNCTWFLSNKTASHRDPSNGVTKQI